MPSQPGDAEVTFADVSKARELPGYKPSTRIQAGLAKLSNGLGQDGSGCPEVRRGGYESEMNESLPAVSLVMPCRNEAAHVEECIRSILAAQQVGMTKFELIVADGMSNDGTREILNRMTSQATQLRVVDNRDR